MICSAKNLIRLSNHKKTALMPLCILFLLALSAESVFAQKKFSRNYPAGDKITLQLINRTGTITVRGWNRKQVNISARLEKPAAKIEPRSLSDGSIIINVIKDNKGRAEVGSANFEIWVPYASSINIETVIGNLEVANIQGGLVSANITAEGDITLTNIGAKNVSAENVIGNIFYDGIIQPAGTYRFKSVRGDISLRIPFKSSFSLVATAPSTRYISLGSFSNENMSYVGNGRRVVGRRGDGNATLNITNQRGSISFFSR